MYIALKKSNVSNYCKMAGVDVKTQLRTQEGILYISLSKAEGRKGLAAREAFAAVWGRCTSVCFVSSLPWSLPYPLCP